MRLLKDDELVPLVTGAQPILTGHGYQNDWYASTSPVQPASIDLAIGDIFLPGAKRNDDGGELAPLSNHYLQSGQTAIVATRERLALPANLAAFGFPPSHVSAKGLLMTNPGHVDPGLSGILRFTLINMGSKPYLLERGSVIATLLIVELSGNCKRDWSGRGNRASPIKQSDIEVLSSDFLDVERRARDVTERAVNAASLRAILISAVVPVVAGVLALATQIFPTLLTPQWRWELQTKLASVEAATSVGKVEGRVSKIEDDLNAVKMATCRQTPVPTYCPAQAPAPPVPPR